MTFEHVGWLVINILLPFFLPILGLLSFKILPLPAAIEVRFIALIKDGQWCWTAIALSVSTVFEYLNTQRISTSTFSRDSLFLFFNWFDNVFIRGISMLKYITYRFSDAEKARTTMCVVSLTYCAFAFLSLIVIMIFT